MHHFNIYKKDDDLIAVKVGWNWTALIFGCFWAAFVRLWKVFGWFAAVAILIMVISELVYPMDTLVMTNAMIFEEVISWIVSIGISILFGLNGNEWHRNRLLSQGYKNQILIEAKNKEQALIRYHGSLNGEPLAA